MNDKLAQLEELAKAAAPGPWKVEPRNSRYWNDEDNTIKPFDEMCRLAKQDTIQDILGADLIGPREPSRSQFYMNDALYLAAVSPDVILSLIGKLKAAREALASIDCTDGAPEVCQRSWRIANKALEELERE